MGAAVTPTETTGVLVIRAWIEVGDERALRARITSSLDVSAAEPLEHAVASEAEVVAFVQAWLGAFVGSSVTPE